MPEKYRVAVIGHTGKGNYGHGLDVAWMQIPNLTVEMIAGVFESQRRGRAVSLPLENRKNPLSLIE